MGQIIHPPKVIMNKCGWMPTREPDNDAAILEVADLMAQRCFHCAAEDLTDEQSDWLVAMLAALWVGVAELEHES